MRAIDDPVAYNAVLYGRSERERIRRINYTRQRRGMPLVSNLNDVYLRRPMDG